MIHTVTNMTYAWGVLENLLEQGAPSKKILAYLKKIWPKTSKLSTANFREFSTQTLGEIFQ